ncbi:MAG: hypothetical protein AAF702_25245 [Chloroflexota bacterium]
MQTNHESQTKSLLTRMGEALDQHRSARQTERHHHQDDAHPGRDRFRQFLPTPGNVIFTFLIIGGLLLAQNSGALTLFAAPDFQSASTGTIAYQGRLADTAGTPLTDTYSMGFRLYSAATGGAPLWTEEWNGPNGVRVSDGLFNVMLGSLTPIPQAVITSNENLFLGITVGTDDEMAPRVQLGTVPFATQALTVPDGSITQQKASFAPQSYYRPNGAPTHTEIDKPIIYTTWFHGSDEGYALYDLSDLFTEIYAVNVTKSKHGNGNDNQATFMVTDASGQSPPTPSEIKVWAYKPDGSGLQAWIQGHVVIIGR